MSSNSIKIPQEEIERFKPHNIRYNMISRNSSLLNLEEFKDGDYLTYGYFIRPYNNLILKSRFYFSKENDKTKIWLIQNKVVTLVQNSIQNSNYYQDIIVITNYQEIVDFIPSNEKDDKLIMNQEIRRRMKDFVGMDNLSLFLRNSEHIVNYILFGKWESKDTTKNDNILIYNNFYKLNLDDITKLKINSLPYLMVKERFNKNLESNDKSFSFLETIYNPFELNLDVDNNEIENSKMILVVGPEGSGKTTLINTLFNKDLFHTGLSEKDKSYDIYFVKSKVNNNDKQQEVIFIDTFGFFTDNKDIKDLCKELDNRVKNILKKIHLFIVVIQGNRISNNVEKNMLKFLEESEYKVERKKFLFIITNTINSEEKDKEKYKEDIKKNFKLREEEDEFSSFLFFNHFVERKINETTKTILQFEINTIQEKIIDLV